MLLARSFQTADIVLFSLSFFSFLFFPSFFSCLSFFLWGWGVVGGGGGSCSCRVFPMLFYFLFYFQYMHPSPHNFGTAGLFMRCLLPLLFSLSLSSSFCVCVAGCGRGRVSVRGEHRGRLSLLTHSVHHSDQPSSLQSLRLMRKWGLLFAPI